MIYGNQEIKKNSNDICKLCQKLSVIFQISVISLVKYWVRLHAKQYNLSYVQKILCQ